MLKNPTILIPLLVLFGCLPPPHAWPEYRVDSGDAGIDTSGGPGDDTAIPILERFSIEFDANGHLSIPSSDLVSGGSFYTNEDFTIEFWAWFADVDLSIARTLVSFGNDSAWRVGTDAGDLVFQAKGLEIRGSAPQAGWHHVAVVKEIGPPGEIRMYVDGSLFSEVLPFSESFSVPEDDVLHVARAHGFGSSWESAMDELRFSNQALYAGATINSLDALDLSPWLGVWHFSQDLANALNPDREAAGSGYTFNPSDPFP